jgi:hypothetical protein
LNLIKLNFRNNHKYWFLILLTILQSCNVTKYLEDDEFLLDTYSIDSDSKVLSKEEYKNYVKQKPNKRIIGWKFYLSLYNLSNEKKDNGFNRWLRRIGEEPVAYSPDLTDYTSQQLELLLYNKGYFNAEVKDTTIYKKKRAKVHYSIDSKEPYTIHNIDYFFEDGNLGRYVMSDSIPTLLNVGDRFDVDELQTERVRIETILRNKGYYNFTDDFIYFEIDSSLSNNQVDVLLGIKNFPVKDEFGRIERTRHKVYTINDIIIKTDYDLLNRNDSENELPLQDTIVYDGVYLISNVNSKIRPGVITQKNYIAPGDRYNARRVQRTYRNLSALSAYRIVDVKFEEVDSSSTQLDCEIKMLPSVKQAFTGGIEGTNSEGNFGVAGNLNYQHRNLFGGSEKFDVTFTGAIETIRRTDDDDLGTVQEIGVETRLTVPKFLLPFKTEQFIRKFNPQSNINFAFNYQKRPDYTRSTFRGGFGYQWRGNGHLTHTVYPFEASLIHTPYVSDSLADRLEGTYLFYSYQPHFITDLRYSLVFNNQKVNKASDFQYVRFNIETAGNLLYGVHSALRSSDSDATLQIFGVDYAQYLKSDFEFRHYDYLDEGISLIYRTFIGAAVPYLNSTAIPFEKQYFGGGANSIRAWRVKNLGPGSSSEEAGDYPNQTADLKLEFNIEYRFKLFWKLEGALFVDAGNIWSLSPDDEREGARFNMKRFYKEFAVGTGFGTRFDFNFFIFRFDIGVPLVDPSYPLGERWLPNHSGIKFEDLAYNFAIGYPF